MTDRPAFAVLIPLVMTCALALLAPPTEAQQFQWADNFHLFISHGTSRQPGTWEFRVNSESLPSLARERAIIHVYDSNDVLLTSFRPGLLSAAWVIVTIPVVPDCRGPWSRGSIKIRVSFGLGSAPLTNLSEPIEIPLVCGTWGTSSRFQGNEVLLWTQVHVHQTAPATTPVRLHTVHTGRVPGALVEDVATGTYELTIHTDSLAPGTPGVVMADFTTFYDDHNYHRPWPGPLDTWGDTALIVGISPTLIGIPVIVTANGGGCSSRIVFPALPDLDVAYFMQGLFLARSVPSSQLVETTRYRVANSW